MNLKIYLETEKPWLDPGFSVKNLLTEYNSRSGTTICYETLTRISRHHYGISAFYVLNEYRAKYAMTLIQKGYSGNLENLHELCGFVTMSNFYKWFKMVNKMTPGEYRNRWRFNRASLVTY